MIQHHLVHHNTPLDEGITYYSANMHAAYYLSRSGKILEFIEDRLGQYAATVISTIMYLGHAQVSHLETLPELRPDASETNGVHDEQEEPQGDGDGTNGMNGDHVPEQSTLHPTLKTLAAHGYILRVREGHFQSYADNILDIERQIKAGDSVQSLKGKKLEEYVLEKTGDMLKERLDSDLTRGLLVNGVPRGVKRRRVNGSLDEENKRARFDYDNPGGEDEEENEWFDDEIPMEVRSLYFWSLSAHN
jgi:DNA-directed RNA polymerase III subunit RPC3